MATQTTLIPITQAYKGKDYIVPKVAVVKSVGPLPQMVKPVSSALPAKKSIASVPIVQISSQLKNGTPLTQTEFTKASSAAKSIVTSRSPSLTIFQPVITAPTTALVEKAVKSSGTTPAGFSASDMAYQGKASSQADVPSKSNALIFLAIGVVIFLFFMKFRS